MTRDFFLQDAVSLAKSLLGNFLVRKVGSVEIITKIVETEAYMGLIDSACHSYGGRRTKRTETMYKPGGYSYVYLIYGIHYMLNIVASCQDDPQAVLIRGVEPVSDMLSTKKILTNGPGKLSKFLYIDKNLDSLDLLNSKELFVVKNSNKNFNIKSDKRINIDYANQYDVNKPWRFYIENNKFVSKF